MKMKERTGTDNDSSNTAFGITVLLQVMGDGDENARRQGHVEDPILLLLSLLQLLQMFIQLNERAILVVLPRNVCAEAAEGFQLLFNLFCGDLNVGPDPPDVICMVHLCSGISDDLNVLGKEFVSILHVRSKSMPSVGPGLIHLPAQKAPETGEG